MGRLVFGYIAHEGGLTGRKSNGIKMRCPYSQGRTEEGLWEGVASPPTREY